MANARSLHFVLAAPVVLAVAACAGNGGALPSAQPMMQPVAVVAGATDTCKGQSTTSEYAMSKPVGLKFRGGTTCIPSFGGFTGELAYPTVHPLQKGVVFTDSTTNFNHMLPTLRSKGKPVFYLQFATSDPVKLGGTLATSGALTSPKIKAGFYYSVYGQAAYGGVAHIFVPFTPCKAKATTGKGGGTISGLGTVLENNDLTGSATITIEVYPGRTASTSC